jgi:hypothetical protein
MWGNLKQMAYELAKILTIPPEQPAISNVIREGVLVLFHIIQK